MICFACLKAVGKSVEQSLAYYDNNVVGSLGLLEMHSRGENTRIYITLLFGGLNADQKRTLHSGIASGRFPSY